MLSDRLLFAIVVLLSLLLAACGPSEPAPVAAAAGEGAAAAVPQASVDAAAPDVAAPPPRGWRPADLVLPAGREERAALLALALEAETGGHLFGGNPLGALDLYLALARAPEPPPAVEAGRLRVIARLGGEFDAALLHGDLERAAELHSVLAIVQPEQAEARAHGLDDGLAAAEHVARGDERQQGGAWTAPRGASAVAAYRAALDRLPGYRPALQGLRRIERALLDRALVAAADGRYREAESDLRRAGRLGLDAAAVQDGHAAVSQRRAERAAAALAAANLALERLDLPGATRELAAAEAAEPQFPGIDEAKQRLALARRYGHFRPGQRFADALVGGGFGPSMVVVPHGHFTMGAGADDENARDNERPAHPVRFERGFALAVHETTVAEFARFIAATGHVTVAERNRRSTVYDERGGAMIEQRGAHWRRSFDGRRAAGDDEPVVHVAFQDAAAYADWLAALSGQRYRLPSEAEFEYALRAGEAAPWPWGTSPPSLAPGNLTGDGERSPQGRRWGRAIRDWNDGAWGPVPAGRFPVEGFGTYDLIGNVSEWVEDCWHDSFRRAPGDGRAWLNPGCAERVVRGGSWASTRDQARSAFRLQVPADLTSARVGFRVARDL